MLPDQSSSGLPKEVAGDVAKVRAAYASATNAVGETPAGAALRALGANIDDWAQRGTAAAATTNKTPGANGWPGWVQAGTTLLQGIEDIAHEGKTYRLDAITATVLKVPEETLKTIAKNAEAVQRKAAAAAQAAVDTVGALGSGLGQVATRIGLAAVAVVVLLAVVKRSV